MAFKHHIYLWQIWIQILVAINSEPCQTSFPSFFAPPWSHCAVLFKSEQRPFSQTGHLRRFRSSALLRIRFRTRPTNDWAKQWALLWSALNKERESGASRTGRGWGSVKDHLGSGGGRGRGEQIERGELTGFSPRIDRIFPSSTSKQYLKG